MLEIGTVTGLSDFKQEPVWRKLPEGKQALT